MSTVEIIENAGDNAIARWLHRKLSAALLATGDSVAISLPGGSTPFPILHELIAIALNWTCISVWPGDDRLVPESHSASNTGKIRALLEPLGASVIKLEEAISPPRFALAWLGMGADGHIASLFPSSDPQMDDPLSIIRLTPDPLPPDAPFDRISLTIPALLNSDALVLVTRGADKRTVLEDAVAGKNDLPVARLLGAAVQPVTCFT